MSSDESQDDEETELHNPDEDCVLITDGGTHQGRTFEDEVDLSAKVLLHTPSEQALAGDQ